MEAFRNRLYGGILKGHYTKRKGAIRDAGAANELKNQEHYDVNSEFEERTTDKSRKKNTIPPEYSYPDAYQNVYGIHTLPINVTGSSENPQDFSNVKRGSNAAGGNIVDAYVTNNGTNSNYTRTETPTEYGPYVHSQLELEDGDPQMYQKYPEGFGGFPAHEGSYTEKIGPFGFGYQTAQAPKDRSLLSLIRERF